MKRKPFKIITCLLLISNSIFAQKFDKKTTENFTVNKDVAVHINASNADIDVSTWNKNQVAIESTIEVEGLSKKEAQKYLDKWKFEALGNSSTVKINARTSGFHSFDNDNFVFFNGAKGNFPKAYTYSTNADVIVIPELPEMPELPEIETIEIPEIDFDEIVTGLEHIEFDFDKYVKDGKKYFFQWKDGVNDITIKSKKEWEEFKKSKKYKKFKESQEERQKKLKKELEKLKSIQSKEVKRELARAKAEIKKINREEIKRELANAKRQLAKTKGRSNFIFLPNKGEFTVNGKKVTVTKKIKIKVPKKATFNLNTRHCKVKLPNTKASGKVSYGTFNADVLNGGELNVSFSPVTINSLNACTLFLNNVTDAQLASVTKSILNSNSSEVVIANVYEDVNFTSSFGDVVLKKIHPNYNTFKIDLNSSKATINLTPIQQKLNYVVGQKAPHQTSKSAIKFSLNNPKREINGNFLVSSKDKKVIIKGKYSQLAF